MGHLERARRLLGVTPDATRSEVKSAYRKAARRYHPDLNHADGAEEKFRRYTAAYQTALAHAQPDPPRRQTQTRQKSPSRPRDEKTHRQGRPPRNDTQPTADEATQEGTGKAGGRNQPLRPEAAAYMLFVEPAPEPRVELYL